MNLQTVSTTNLAQSYRIEVSPQAAFVNNAEGLPAIRQLGIGGIHACRQVRLYFLAGALTPDDVAAISLRLLADPVTERFTIVDAAAAPPSTDHTIEVTLLPGVTDPVAENLVRAAHLLGFTALEQAATGQQYLLQGAATEPELQRIAARVLANPVIQRFVIGNRIQPPFTAPQPRDETVETVSLCAADDAALLAVSSARRMALDLNEMRAIRTYFQQEEREPTDAELETLAQTWSEHCVHKTFRAQITCRTADGQEAGMVNGLLRTYIRAATERIAKPWVRSAFVDNAGVIAFDERWDLAFKVETHNHPSALEPFGGAHTGVGGVVRDILGISARPIANTDVLCFGPPDLPEAELPAGTLHPQRIAAGVTHGIEDYGNKMGIPTVNGAIFYHRGYTANPLVFCGSLGLLPRNSHPTAAQPNDLIVVIGGRTGRDGLRGATFSSMEMDQSTSAIAGSAVQIGHPIQEKQVLEVVLRARDAGLYHAITDCGAGGLASAVGEMGSQLGATVELAYVPLKYPGLRPWETWLSEAQERMVLAVAPAHWPQLQTICAGQNVEAVAIGVYAPTGRLHLTYNARRVADLSMHFLHEGIPQRRMEALLPNSDKETERPRDRETERLRDQETKRPRDRETGRLGDKETLAESSCHLVILSSCHLATTALLALLAHPNIRSKEAVIRRYDHEVQGGTAVKPLIGVANQGPSDAAVIVPLGTVDPQARPEAPVRGASLSVGLCPRYGEQDPYRMAWAAVDEAIRNAVCVGADPDQVALLDNFCWGKPTLPDRLGSLVRCAQGCYDAAVAYAAPFISGKDSLNNEYLGADGRSHAIPGTLLISALGIVPDVRQSVTMDLKATGNWLYLVGETRAEVGESHYQEWVRTHQGQEIAGVVPQPVMEPLTRLRALHQAMRAGLLRACHDCSEGGLAVALAEMSLAGRLGVQAELGHAPWADPAAPQDDLLLFAESAGRFVVEVRPDAAAAFESQLTGIPHARIGTVTDASETARFQLHGLNGAPIIDTTVGELEVAWRGAIAPSAVPNHDPQITQVAQIKKNLRKSADYAQGKPRVLILHANGTNRDREAALACELAGATAEIVHINQLLAGEQRLLDYGMLVLPGGFSYGDDLGAGALWALQLHQRIGHDLAQFAETGRPLLGICNGFQALVKAGLLPGGMPLSGVGFSPAPNLPQVGGGTAILSRRSPLPPQSGEGWGGVIQKAGTATRTATLTHNASGHFECRWVYLQANPASPSIFTQGLTDWIYCPVAHGEGRFVAEERTLEGERLIALTYVDPSGAPAVYPSNPNGSMLNIAGVCNAAGNILGLMPHPEDHLFAWQHPHWRRGQTGTAPGLLGLPLFAQGVRYAQC